MVGVAIVMSPSSPRHLHGKAKRERTFITVSCKGSRHALSPVLSKRLTRSGGAIGQKRRFAAAINALDAAGQRTGVRELSTRLNILIVGGYAIFPKFCRI